MSDEDVHCASRNHSEDTCSCSFEHDIEITGDTEVCTVETPCETALLLTWATISDMAC